MTYYEPFALSADTMTALEAKRQAQEPQLYHNPIAAILLGAPKIGDAPRGSNQLYSAIDPRLNLGDAEGY